MPADNSITITGFITKAGIKYADAGTSRPSSFRIGSYCSGSKEKDNIRRVYLNVLCFDSLRETLHGLDLEERVRAVGRFNTWDDKEGHQVIEMVADTVEQVDRDGNVIDVASSQDTLADTDPDYEGQSF